MRRSLLSLLALVSVSWASTSDDWYTIWSRAGNTWHQKWDRTLQNLDSLPHDLKLDLLGRATAMGNDPRMSTEKAEIVARAKSALLTIPGHAEYYRDKINDARERMETALRNGDEAEYIQSRTELTRIMDYEFPTLAQLPSVETVRVLGEFLFDERGYVKVPLEDSTELERYQSVKHSPVYRKAAAALATLPIVGKLPPPEMRYGGPEDTVAWKQWYQEIKDGKRTFRFEGDPTEYDLNGPAPKEKLERIALAAKRDAERGAGRHPASQALSSENATDAKGANRKTAVGALGAACLLLAGSLVWYLRTKQAANRRSNKQGS